MCGSSGVTRNAFIFQTSIFCREANRQPLGLDLAYQTVRTDDRRLGKLHLNEPAHMQSE